MRWKYLKNPVTGELALVGLTNKSIPVPKNTLRGIVARNRNWDRCLAITKKEFQLAMNRSTAPRDFIEIQTFIGAKSVAFKEGEGFVPSIHETP